MKKIIKAFTLLILALTAILGIFTQNFNRNITVIPVEDGIVIAKPNTQNDYLHLSLLNTRIEYPDKYKRQFLNEEDATPGKSIQYPTFPSFQETYNVNKEFSSYKNKTLVTQQSRPSFDKDLITIDYAFTSPFTFPLLVGIELMDDNVEITEGKNFQLLEFDSCTLEISSTGDFFESTKDIIWYITDEQYLTFEIKGLCEK